MEPDDYRRIEEDLQNQLHAKNQQKFDAGHQKVETWNCNFDSSNTADNLSHFSSSTEYDRYECTNYHQSIIFLYSLFHLMLHLDLSNILNIVNCFVVWHFIRSLSPILSYIN